MKKVISYSLYNDIPKNNWNAVINVKLMPFIYPGWISRFYVDKTVPHNILDALQETPDVEIVRMDSHWLTKKNRMMWRFLAAEDADIMICRDADSWISIREARCVEEWLESNDHLHIIRDHCYHSQKMMGGMWGVRGKKISDIEELMMEYFEKVTDTQWDQGFLADCVYPLFCEDMMIHIGNQYNNKGECLLWVDPKTNSLHGGYFPEEGSCTRLKRIPDTSEEGDEPLPGLSFHRINAANSFHCAHCSKTHPVLIGNILEKIPDDVMTVLRRHISGI